MTYNASYEFDLSSLTPSLFLLNIHELGVRLCGYWDAKSLNKVRFLQNPQQNLRKLLSGLLRAPYASGKPKSSYRKVKLRNVVVVGSDHTNKRLWPLPRGIKSIPGTGGVVGITRLKTATREYLWLVQQLYPLIMKYGGN